MSDMTLSIIIFIVSVALLMFYLQVHCEKILLRRLNQQFFHSVVEAYPLEFPRVRKALEEFDVPVEYRHVRMQLKRDFLALTYLLRNARNARLSEGKRPLTLYLSVETVREFVQVVVQMRRERLLRVYFLGVFSVFWIRHKLGLSEGAAVLKLTSILEYFANVLGERVDTIRTIRFG